MPITTTSVIVAAVGNGNDYRHRSEVELDGAAGGRKSKRSMKRRRRRVSMLTMMHSILLVIAVLLVISLEVAEGRRDKRPGSQRRTMKSRARSGKDFSEFLLVIGVVMACVIMPVFFFFLHSLYKDPAVPELARAGWKALKDKTLSYLGQQQAHDSTPPRAARVVDRHARDNHSIGKNAAGRVPWAHGDAAGDSSGNKNAEAGRVPWVPGDAARGATARPRAGRRTASAAPDRSSSSSPVSRRAILTSGDGDNKQNRNRGRQHGVVGQKKESSVYDYASYGRRDRRDTRRDEKQQQQQQQHSFGLLPREEPGWAPPVNQTTDGIVPNARRNHPDMAISSRKGMSAAHAMEREDATASGRNRNGDHDRRGGGGGGGGGGEQGTEFHERRRAYIGAREARWDRDYR